MGKLGSAEVDTFHAELVEWLDNVEVPEGLRDYGATPTLEDIGPAKSWQRMLHDSRWAGLSWPGEWGGRDASPLEQAVFAEEMARRGLPRQLNIVSLDLAGPMIIAFGTEQQKARHLPRILRGEEVWAQLFSEPGAGFDLADLQSRAEPDGDLWRVTGQKVWTSGAHYSDYGLLLARTDPDAARHRGISCFCLPMDRAGMEIRPLRQMDGESKFNEVFLDDVLVSPDDLLGRPGQGWEVALSTLGRERVTLGAQAVALRQLVEEAAETASAREAYDACTRDRAAQLWSRVWLLRTTWLRGLAAPGDDGAVALSVLKLAASELQRDVTAFGVSARGPAAQAGVDGACADRFLAAPGATIAGGTSEIQRNILAERQLGLPR
jgi:alkylation response protein AidB-like acyl-CoA dehydrogenase